MGLAKERASIQTTTAKKPHKTKQNKPKKTTNQKQQPNKTSYLMIKIFFQSNHVAFLLTLAWILGHVSEFQLLAINLD